MIVVRRVRVSMIMMMIVTVVVVVVVEKRSSSIPNKKVSPKLSSIHSNFACMQFMSIRSMVLSLSVRSSDSRGCLCIDFLIADANITRQ